ncbi:DUF3558 domain-containing protein [Actinacidiphila oryziradicis]|uniref:DUF3558 domain-containing protein n=1 Tax=Actinacidiphila oryziradicis TaxID=2571141 RepID=UPI0023F295FB|nr:DUF3558 domain-containing protein [Actinacidiphila oryziradicis]
MQRSAPRLARLLASAAVPVMLIAGCSSGSDSSSSKKASDGNPSVSGSASPSPSPTLAAAKYTKLPDPCKSVTQKTVKQLVPKVKDTSGLAAKSSDATARGGCSWNGLDGFQYRWLDVAMQRFETVPGIGSAEEQAVKRYGEQVAAATATKGAKSGAVAGLGGDTATMVTAEVTKDKEQYQQVTVVTRTGNVVAVLSYNGAGMESAKTPKAADLQKGAKAAAKEAMASVSTTNT